MNDQPVTGRELVEALATLKQELLEAIFESFEKRLEATKREILEVTDERLDKRLEKTETALLKAFFGYQEHAEVRMRKISADVSNINAASNCG